MSFPRTTLLAALALFLAACGGKGVPAAGGAPAEPDRAVVSVESVDAHTAPSVLSPVVRSLARGTELKVLEAREGFWRVKPSSGGEGWVEAGSFESARDREAREKRAAVVASFAPEPGRAVESAPILLAPAYGAARWGEVEDGDDLVVLLHDHDFYGIRIPAAKLAFVPARSIRLLPSPLPGGAEPPQPRRQIVPHVTSIGDPGAVSPPEAPASPGTVLPAQEAPLESLPAGAEPPLLLSRVEPGYPESARRAGVGGEVTLRVVVTADGSIGNVDVVSGAPMGLSAAAVDAVSRWKYRPARVGDRAVAVVKIVRVRFAPGR